MEIIILVVVMIVVGWLMGQVAGAIWKDDLPLGKQGNTIAAIVTCIVVGLLDWYVIPAMGFSETLKYIGVAMEPALGALLVLWLIRRARQ